MDSNQSETVSFVPYTASRLVTKFSHFSVNIHPIDENTIIPKRATSMSAGMDCHLHHIKKIISPIGSITEFPHGNYTSVTLHPDSTVLVSLGFRASFTRNVENDETYIPLARLYPRSGLALKHGIVLRNLVGIMDADYEGEYCAMLHNTSSVSHLLRAGDRVCQMIIEQIPNVTINVVEGFEHTSERGQGGFGSTGV